MHTPADVRLERALLKSIRTTTHGAAYNLRWLRDHMPQFFFITMRDEEEALARLATNLRSLQRNRHLILADQEKELTPPRTGASSSGAS